MPTDSFKLRSLSSLTELEMALSGAHLAQGFLSPALQVAISGTLDTPATASMRAVMDAARAHDSVMGKQLSALDAVGRRMAPMDPWHGTAVQDYFKASSKNSLASAISEIIGRSASYGNALETAKKLGPLGITGLLEQHRLGASALAEQLVITGQASAALRDPSLFGAFDVMSAANRMLKDAGAFGLEANETLKRLMADPVIGGFGLRDYRVLLDAAGLNLPRWPRFRPVTTAERAARQRKRMAKHKQPLHRTRAQSIVYQHESYLREAIDELLVDEYGDDWAEDRLPRCGQDGRALLGRWRARGGMPLDHADYAHYRAIIIQEEHFERIFCVAFSDPGAAENLIDRARTLRAASHHPVHSFSREDLRELRLTWSAIKAAFLEFQSGFVLADSVQ